MIKSFLPYSNDEIKVKGVFIKEMEKTEILSLVRRRLNL